MKQFNSDSPLPYRRFARYLPRMTARFITRSVASIAAFSVGCASVPVAPTSPLTASAPPAPPPIAVTKAAVDTPVRPVTDTYHGVPVVDRYRWLEDGDSAEVAEWTAKQNEQTQRALAEYFSRSSLSAETLRARIRSLLQIGAVGGPRIATAASGERIYFHTKREGAQNQPTLYVRNRYDGKDRVLIDASALSADGTAAIDWWEPSLEGRLVAWGVSESGNEESTLHLRDVATGKDLADTIKYTRNASIAWRPGGKSFFYTRYPAPGSVPPGDEKYFRKVYEHRIGQDPKTDRYVFGEGREKTDSPTVTLSPNGRWLVARVHEGWQKSELYLLDLAKKGATWREIATGSDALFDPVALNDKLYIHTNFEAPRYRLVAVDYAAPTRDKWRPVIAESEDVLTDVTILKGSIVATYLHDASSRIQRLSRAGKPIAELPLPSIGTASLFGDERSDELFIHFSSFATPPSVERIDGKTGKEAMWDQVGAKFRGGQYAVSRIYATSADGTRVPLFIVEKPGTPHDSTRAAVLNGYGGFNISMTPGFNSRALLTAEYGGVWATAVLRGGGEFGETWHRAGMLGNKQHVFDDFIACAEELVHEKITTPNRLGIVGGSNGGLLVATAITQRPELFRAALSLVPLTDMLRYDNFRIGKLWVPEYGTSASAEQFQFLYAYSPYHHVVDGKRYPAVLVGTAESDSRVDPMHARKFAARLQAAKSGAEPVLLRVESKAGHGAGKPISKLVDQLTDEMGFLFYELGMTTPSAAN